MREDLASVPINLSHTQNNGDAEMTASGSNIPKPDRASFTACLAEILKVDLGEISALTDDPRHVEIGYWLAAQNLALVPVKDPSNFQWAGWWIGRLADGDGYLVMAGTPSGVAWVPEGVSGGSGDVVEGWVIASPALTLRARASQTGAIKAIFRYPGSGVPGEELQSARLLAGVGMEGDRYALGTGHFQSPGRWGQALTLIEAEAIGALEAEHGIVLPPEAARRNIVTRGVDLNGLMGRKFRIGGVLCQGSRLAEPCSWLQKTTHPGTLRGLVHRGGLRADILSDGTISTGDQVEPA